MPIDFIIIDFFFQKVMWLKQNWVAETGFIQ